MPSYRSSVTFESDTKPCVTVRGAVRATALWTAMSKAVRIATRDPEVKGKVWRSSVCVLERVDVAEAEAAALDTVAAYREPSE